MRRRDLVLGAVALVAACGDDAINFDSFFNAEGRAMKLFADGTWADDTDPRSNLFYLGDDAGGNTIISWQLPADPRLNQELIVSCHLTAQGYFAALAGGLEGHMGFMIRSVIPDLALGNYKGQGPIFGKVWTGGGGPPYVTGTYPCFQLEDWGLPDQSYLTGFEYLRTNSNSPTVIDSTRYLLSASSKRLDGSLYFRYSVGFCGGSCQYVPFFDTGDVESLNTTMDRNNEALTLFDIGAAVRNNNYRIKIGNLQARQVPASYRVPDRRFEPGWVRP